MYIMQLSLQCVCIRHIIVATFLQLKSNDGILNALQMLGEGGNTEKAILTGFKMAQ